LLKLIDVLEASDELLSFDHAIDLIQFRKKVRAAKLYFLAGSARTLRVCFKGHDVGFLSGGGIGCYCSDWEIS
jgi:hypothetical protein